MSESEFPHIQLGSFSATPLPQERPWKSLVDSREVLERLIQESATGGETGTSKRVVPIHPENRIVVPLVEPETGPNLFQQKAQEILKTVQSVITKNGRTDLGVSQLEREYVLKNLPAVITSQLARPVVQEILDRTGIEPEEVRRYIFDQWSWEKPPIRPQVINARSKNAVAERRELIRRQPLVEIDQVAVERVCANYQRVEIVVGTATFPSSLEVLLLWDLKKEILQDVRDLEKLLRERQYPPLDQAAVLHIVTTHPFIVLRDDATC